MSDDDLLLDIIARSIGRTITQENYRQRAADVLRSIRDNDLTLPKPTRTIDDEITRLRAENKRLRRALNPFADAASTDDYINDIEIAETDTARKITFGDLRRARAALEGVTEPASPWRDIESAPKDGTWIFIYKDSWHGAIKAKWDSIDGVDSPFRAWVFQDEFLCIGCAEGCLGYNEDIEDGYMPTHWRPLSGPPQQSGDVK